jgi:hypothetical protein
MPTTAQNMANRNNSRKSTGPKTNEGKTVVSQNAIKHGLFAAEAVITGENPADYELYHDQFLAELVPIGMVESMMAERIVSLAWRLRRAERMQNQAIDVMLARIETNPWEKTLRERTAGAQDPRAGGLELMLGWATNDDFSNARVLDRLLMYERRIENSLQKTINKLKTQQAIRAIQRADAREKENDRAISSLMDEAATHPAGKKDDLKKQSQLSPTTMGATSFMQGDYDNYPAGGVEENKANQSQLHESVLTKLAGKREKSVGAAT